MKAAVGNQDNPEDYNWILLQSTEAIRWYDPIPAQGG